MTATVHQHNNHIKPLMKKALLIAVLVLTAATSVAQDGHCPDISAEARLDYTQEYLSADKVGTASGFKGRFFNIRMDGALGGGFTYSFRHRLNRLASSESFFNATDWIELRYTTGNWSFAGGKQIVGIGGYDYDRAPIDLYFYSEYLNNIDCYQLGVSSTFTTSDRKDSFMLQFCQSPFRTDAANVSGGEMFAYNLMWFGSHGAFDSIWSVNMIEYLPGKYINYIALGNKFSFGGFALELDLTNRAVSARNFLGKDYTVMGKLVWSPAESLNIFLKCSYDRNDSGDTGDWCVVSGTKITRIGGGLEYFPLKNSKAVRFHLSHCYTDGANGSPAGILQPEQNIIDAGITWKMNILKRRNPL